MHGIAQLFPSYRDDHRLIFVVSVASFIGWLCYLGAGVDRSLGGAVNWILSDRGAWQYFLFAPLLHGGFLHVLFNTMVWRFLGHLLLRVIRPGHLAGVFALGWVSASAVNTLMTPHPAIGISGAVFAVVGLALFPFGQLPVRLLLIHDLFRLQPFRLRNVVLVLMSIDIAAIAFDFQFFAHWAHLGGLLCGVGCGIILYRRLPR